MSCVVTASETHTESRTVVMRIPALLGESIYELSECLELKPWEELQWVAPIGMFYTDTEVPATGLTFIKVPAFGNGYQIKILDGTDVIGTINYGARTRRIVCSPAETTTGLPDPLLQMVTFAFLVSIEIQDEDDYNASLHQP